MICHLCRDFSHGLEIGHDLDGTSAVLELEQRLVQNIHIDEAIKTFIVDMNTQITTLLDRAKGLQEEMRGLRGELETVQQERTPLVDEKSKLQKRQECCRHGVSLDSK